MTPSSSSRPPPPVWRSVLYVPGNVPKFIDKAHERGADCILVDLEDSVTPAEKPTARAMLPETMKKVVRGGADVAVRINRPMRLAVPDLEAAVRPGLSALFITKTESVQHLRLLDEAVSELEKERGMPVGSVGCSCAGRSTTSSTTRSLRPWTRQHASIRREIRSTRGSGR